MVLRPFNKTYAGLPSLRQPLAQLSNERISELPRARAEVALSHLFFGARASYSLVPPLSGPQSRRSIGSLPPATARIVSRSEVPRSPPRGNLRIVPSRPTQLEETEEVSSPQRSKGKSAFDHLVVIPTQNRPEYLGVCLKSIAENIRVHRYAGKVRVVIVDDSTDPKYERQNAKVIKQIKKRFGKLVEFTHFDKSKQAQLKQAVKSNLPTEVDLNKFLHANGKDGKSGYGGVRNLASLVAISLAEKRDLVTFLDDDISLKNLSLTQRNNEVKPATVHNINYFETIDRAFLNPHVKIASGSVTKDARE
ncbi:MAG: glycosyltransferase, partial [Candidatus Woesearchaeota archaeon]|nr:glycosyltransferase [Candidatus Woesearchaeota archaeon]